MMGRAIEEFGAIDILVNNAGIQHVAPIDEFPIDKWNAIIALNLTASFHTIRLALPRMKAKTWGRIINIASAHALVASPYKSAYVAAKHGIAGLTKTVALEVAQTAWSAFFSRQQLAALAARQGLRLVQEDPCLAYEEPRHPAGEWPPTPWYPFWARGHNVFDRAAGPAPIELHWLEYRRS